MWKELYRFKTARFSVVCDIAPENDSPWDHFYDDPETAAAISEGKIDWFTARVRVLFDGRDIGSDYLGACAYENASDFIGGGYFRDMVRLAIADARELLRAI